MHTAERADGFPEMWPPCHPIMAAVAVLFLASADALDNVRLPEIPSAASQAQIPSRADSLRFFPPMVSGFLCVYVFHKANGM